MLKTELNSASAMQRNEFIKGFIQLADQHKWDFWTTFTLNRPMSMSGARRFSNVIANDFCQPSAFKETGILWVAEPFDAKVGYHIHALLSSSLTLKGFGKRFSELYKDKPNRYGRIKFEAYDSKLGANGYCAKYITKDLSDWDIHRYDYTNRPSQAERIKGQKLIDYSTIIAPANAEDIWQQIENNKL